MRLSNWHLSMWQAETTKPVFSRASERDGSKSGAGAIRFKVISCTSSEPSQSAPN